MKAAFESEADLCAAFIAWAKSQGWTAYAETAGWDILLVGADGTQIGVQAKMAWNMKVLTQTAPSFWDAMHGDGVGPDFRAILLPQHHGGAEDVCGALGITVIAAQGPGMKSLFAPDLMKGRNYGSPGWHWWAPSRRHKLPEYVPDVAAGASGPVQLTEWKVKALKICALLELRGHVTRADFKAVGIDHRRWTGPGDWLRFDKVKGAFVRGPGLDFDRVHRDVYAQVREKVAGDKALMGMLPP